MQLVGYNLPRNQTELEILKSLGGFYDGLAFSPTGPNHFHVS